VISYAALVLLVQRAVAFPGRFRPADQGGPPQGARQVWLDTSFGRVEAWLYGTPASGEGTLPGVLFFHGNGELIDDWPGPMQAVADRGVVTMAVEFPGYGRSAGRPSRATIREAAAAAFDRLAREPGVDARRLVAWGRSMGGGAAADLALDRPVAALVLQSTFASTMAMARAAGVPGFLVRDRFAPADAVAAFTGPVLLMHGPADEVIPYRHARTVAAMRPDLRVVDIPCGHNDCLSAWPDIVEHVTGFLEREGLAP
jgi:pimeloyl-ACP methyl ester carboxylesterase